NYSSYFDNSNGNTGGAHRNDNVDIENATDAGGGYNVGWIESGEWLSYDFNLTEAGNYKLVSRVASAEGGNHSFKASIAGQETQLTLGNTGGWQNWTDVESAQNFTLSAGNNTLRVDMIGNNFNINYFDLVKVEGDTNNSGNPGNNNSNPLRIEAENYSSYFDNSNGNTGGAHRNDNVDIESTSDTGGGYNVGWIESGEWLSYDFNVTEAGNYKLVSRVASAEGGNHSFKASIAGQETQLTLGNTGGWQNWTDVESAQNFTLSAGNNTLRVDMIGSSFNINYFDLVKVEGDTNNSGNPPSPTPQTQTVNLNFGNIFEAGAGNQTYNGSNAIDTVRYANVNSGFGIEGNLETGVVKYKSAPVNSTIKIMPFGDSITDGYMQSDTAGYRDDLWNMLKADGYSIDMVGDKSEGAGTGDFDNDHAGYSGYKINDIASLADGLLSRHNPDAVILMIGTNDIIQEYDLANAPNRLSNLIDKITNNSPDTEVFVASIPPDKNQFRQQRVIDYNSKIPGIVNQKQNQGKKVTFVDMFNQLSTSDLEDDVHPNPGGNAKIAQTWHDALTNHYGQPNTNSGITDNLNNIDNIIGTVYDDALRGNAGDNIIVGGDGYDYIAGGGGRDKFVLASGKETDTIIDFTVNEDLLVLSDGLSYGQLGIASGSSYGYNANDTVIINNNNSEQLAVLTGVDFNTINANSFGVV
ncbi:MAG: carbohydrate-binding protein, partial [Cyanobacteria bacterium P01_A01_bin.84]